MSCYESAVDVFVRFLTLALAIHFKAQAYIRRTETIWPRWTPNRSFTVPRYEVVNAACLSWSLSSEGQKCSTAMDVPRSLFGDAKTKSSRPYTVLRITEERTETAAFPVINVRSTVILGKRGWVQRMNPAWTDWEGMGLSFSCRGIVAPLAVRRR